MEQKSEYVNKHTVQIIYPLINYTIIFLLAGIIVYFIYQLASIYVGTFICKMPLEWSTYMIRPRIPDAAWDMFRVKRFYTFPSYITLIVGVVFSILFLSNYRKKGLLKIFYLWMAFHGFNLFAGHIITGLITKEGFYYPLLWARVSDFVIIAVGMLAVAFMILIGFFATRAVFLIAFSRSFVENSLARSLYLLKLFVLPWFIGSILLIAVKIDPLYFRDYPQFEWLIALPFILYFLPMFYIQHNYRKSEFVIIKDRKHNKINVLLVVITGLVIIAYRILLADGISI